MTEEVEFLFDNQLIAAVEKLIRSAKNRLVLISPFIDLDARIIDALNEKKGLHNFELLVLFGKNEANYLKSIKRDSLEFFKEFPNVEIRYNERLHAKYYQNDFEYIMTSLNLYDYSLANNIEVGVRGEFASRGLIGKGLDVTAGLIGTGIDMVKQDVLGMNRALTPMEKFEMIFEASELKYKTQPIVAEKSGIIGLIGAKKLEGFEVVVNTLTPAPPTSPISYSSNNTLSASTPKQETIPTSVPDAGGKCISASQIGKMFGLQAKDITSFMQQKGFINGEKITTLGASKGLVMKNYMGKDYIAYPEKLAEFNELT